MTTSVKIRVPDNELMVGLLGERDEYLRVVEDSFDATVHVRGNEISLDGTQAQEAAQVIEELVLVLQRGEPLEQAVVRRSIDMIREDERPSEILTDRVLTTYRGKPVRPKTSGQKRYLDAIRHNTVTFGTGPAGTGKTLLAVAYGASLLVARKVEKLIITRPAVEAGEKLGFLPGDLTEKVDPYLLPVWDALADTLGRTQLEKMREDGRIEVAPIAFMRGRTLNRAFIVVDEAQNTSRAQMQMVLTRLGEGSRMAVTGDPSQCDLHPRDPSGLPHALSILARTKGVSINRFTRDDVVRHDLVARIVEA